MRNFRSSHASLILHITDHGAQLASHLCSFRNNDSVSWVVCPSVMQLCCLPTVERAKKQRLVGFYVGLGWGNNNVDAICFHTEPALEKADGLICIHSLRPDAEKQ